MRQLSDILTEERFNSRKPPANPLADMHFVTKVRATAVPSLCRVDRLKVTFRPAVQGKADADTPVSADGFAASHFFHFRELPKSHFADLADYKRAPDASGCAGLTFARDDFFSAADEQVATNGAFAAQKAIASILAGKPDVAFECDKYPTENDRTCTDIVRQLNGMPINSIDECESDQPQFVQARCYYVRIGDRSLRIVASPIAYGDDVLPAFTPLHVKLGLLIVLVHERVD